MQLIMFSILGGPAVGVPGMIKGLEKAWQMFGRLPWADLIQPSIEIARNGFPVSETIEWAIEDRLQCIISGNFTGLL